MREVPSIRMPALQEDVEEFLSSDALDWKRSYTFSFYKMLRVSSLFLLQKLFVCSIYTFGDLRHLGRYFFSCLYNLPVHFNGSSQIVANLRLCVVLSFFYDLNILFSKETNFLEKLNFLLQFLKILK